jgi:xylan 1,4-beta-xylosidase
MVFLTGRPLTEQGRCITGRETAIEKVDWRQDNWLYLSNNSQVARQKVEAPDLPEYKFTADKQTIHFDTAIIDINFQSLRIPMTNDWVNQTDRQGYLRLIGRESLSSCFEQSMIARRVQEHHTLASTCIEFSPENFQQMAGLACYYNTTHYHYLYITGDDIGSYSGKKFLNILSCDDNKTSHPLNQSIEVSNIDKIYLKADFNGAVIQFYYAISREKNKLTWKKIGSELDGSILSDDYVVHTERGYSPCFTGAFFGLACQDLSGQKRHADFEFFTYQENV